MKRIFKFIAICASALFIILFTASCNDANKDVTGSMTITATASTLNISATVVDEKGAVNSKSVRAKYAKLNEDGNPGSYTNITFTTIPLKGEDGTWNSETGTASGLDMETTYRVILYCTIGTNLKTLDEQDVKTTKAGQDEINPIMISTKEELLNMSKDNDAYYKLANDIDLENEAIGSIFNSSTKFAGHFDGDNHKIMNFKQTASAQYEGLFGYVDTNAEIVNLEISGASQTLSRNGATYYAVLAGYNNGTIRNVTISDVNLDYTMTSTTTTSQNVGVIVGHNDISGVIANSSVNGDTKLNIQSHVNFGGIAGQNDGKIFSSTVKANLNLVLSSTSTSTSLYEYNFGGVAGLSSGIIANCIVENTIKASTTLNSSNYTRNYYRGNNIGGLVGSVVAGSVQNCVVNSSFEYKSYQSPVVNLGYLIGLTDTNLNGISALKQNSVILDKNTLTISLLEKDSDWQISVKSDEESDSTTSTETTSTSSTKQIDRVANISLINFLKTADKTNSKLENDFYEAANYFVYGTYEVVIDTINDNITTIPYSIVETAPGQASYTAFANLGENVSSYLASKTNN